MPLTDRRSAISLPRKVRPATLFNCMSRKGSLGAVRFRATILVASLAGAFAPAFPSELPAVTVPAIDNVRISPSGDRILAVSAEGQRRVLVVTDVATGQRAIAYRADPRTQSLDTCEWVSDTRIVCTIFVYPAPGPPWPRERIVRLVLMDHDGSNRKAIFPNPPRRPPKLAGVVPQPDVAPHAPGRAPAVRPYLDLEHALVDPLPGDPDALLVAAAREATPYRTVYRVNAHTARAKRSVGWQGGIVFWHTDQAGVVRAGTGWYEFGHGLPRMWGRAPNEPYIGPTGVLVGDGGWHRLDAARLMGSIGEWHATTTRVLGYSADGTRVYYQANVDGADRSALWEAGANTYAPLRRVVFDATRDVSAGIVAGQACGVLGFMHPLPGRPFTWLDATFGNDIERASGRVAGDVVAVTSMSADCRLVTLASTDHRSRRSFHLLDRSTGLIRGLGEQYPTANGELTARRDLLWTTRDGLSLPMAVTTPSSGPSDALLVLLHGAAPDDSLAPLDLWPHYFASQGYTVAEPAFRGMMGFGKAIHLAGMRQYGRKLRDDIEDAVGWLADRQALDRERVCFLGRGRGGHLAAFAALSLRTAETTDERCAAALAVMDVRDTVRAYDNPFEPILCSNRFACGGWERWASPQFITRKLAEQKHRAREQILQAAATVLPAAQSSFRSPLPDANHPGGFPILIQDAGATVHRADTEAWRDDLEALGVFRHTAPRGTESETGFLHEASALFDHVLRRRERPVPPRP